MGVAKSKCIQCGHFIPRFWIQMGTVSELYQGHVMSVSIPGMVVCVPAERVPYPVTLHWCNHFLNLTRFQDKRHQISTVHNDCSSILQELTVCKFLPQRFGSHSMIHHQEKEQEERNDGSWSVIWNVEVKICTQLIPEVLNYKDSRFNFCHVHCHLCFQLHGFSVYFSSAWIINLKCFCEYLCI